MPFTIVAGQDVYDAQQGRKLIALGDDRFLLQSEPLCEWQKREAGLGIIEATIVKSAYGFSVRYASGLQNFGLIYSARARQVDGTLDGAIAAATLWQQQDPTRRYVSLGLPG